MAGLATSGFWKFAPLAALGGGALAVAAWTLPIPGLKVSPGHAVATDPGAPVPVRSRDEYFPPIPRHDWELLVEPLERIRAPAPEAVVSESPSPPPPPPPGSGRLADWRFVGAVSEPGGMVAIVSISERQRYLSIGQVIPLGGDGTTAEIISVHEDHVVVRVEGVDERVSTDGPAAEGGSPGRASPAGPARGRNPVVPRPRNTPSSGRT